MGTGPVSSCLCDRTLASRSGKMSAITGQRIMAAEHSLQVRANLWASFAKGKNKGTFVQQGERLFKFTFPWAVTAVPLDLTPLPAVQPGPCPPGLGAKPRGWSWGGRLYPCLSGILKWFFHHLALQKNTASSTTFKIFYNLIFCLEWRVCETAQYKKENKFNP